MPDRLYRRYDRNFTVTDEAPMPADPVVTLLPCPNPWCDSDHQWAHRIRPAPHFPEWAVACGCGFMGPALDSEQRAITAWNTRTPTPASGDAGSVREAATELLAMRVGVQPHQGWLPDNDRARTALTKLAAALAAAPTPDAAETVLMPRTATRKMVDAVDACIDAYSAYAAMVEVGHVR